MLATFMQRRFNKWLKRRLPATNQITLDRGNTFIFPSKIGLHYLVTCLILFLLGTNYQNNLILFLVFFLCSFMVTCLLLSYQNIAGLTLKAVNTDAQFAGKDCQFNLRLQQSKIPMQDVSFNFQHPSSDLASVVEQERVCLYAMSKKRGYFNPGRVTISSRFPFGLFKVWTHLDFGFNSLIYPNAVKNKMPMGSSSSRDRDTGVKQSMLGVDEFSTLKSYQLGESLKSVAWKQLAQGRGWLSKQFEQSAGGDLILDINSLHYLALETRLSYLCYQIIELEKKHQRYSLILGTTAIEVGLGNQHKALCLQALALYEGRS